MASGMLSKYLRKAPTDIELPNKSGKVDKRLSKASKFENPIKRVTETAADVKNKLKSLNPFKRASDILDKASKRR